MNETDKNHIKIAVPIVHGPRKGADETLWAYKIDEVFAKIDNIPANVRGLALGDIVEYKKAENDFIFDFVKISKKSGNKTIRTIYKNSLFSKKTKIFLEKILPEISRLGCEYEGDTNDRVKIIGINVPVRTNLKDVIDILSKYEALGFSYEILAG